MVFKSNNLEYKNTKSLTSVDKISFCLQKRKIDR